MGRGEEKRQTAKVSRGSNVASSGSSKFRSSWNLAELLDAERVGDGGGLKQVAPATPLYLYPATCYVHMFFRMVQTVPRCACAIGDFDSDDTLSCTRVFVKVSSAFPIPTLQVLVQSNPFLSPPFSMHVYIPFFSFFFKQT